GRRNIQEVLGVSAQSSAARVWARRSACCRKGQSSGSGAGNSGFRTSEVSARDLRDKGRKGHEVGSNRPSLLQTELLFHFCRMQLPTVILTQARFESHLRRTFDLFQGKASKPVAWEAYLEN